MDPQIHLTQLFTNLHLASDGDLSAWLPGHWKSAQKARRVILQYQVQHP